MKARTSLPHTVIQPSQGDPTGFTQLKFDGRLWFELPVPQLPQVLLPSAIAAACGGQDFTFSSFRRFAKIEPSMFAIPPGSGWSLRIFCPIGGTFEPNLWSSVTYYQSGKPPVAEDGPDANFSAQGGGLQRRLDEALSAERIDKLKQPDSREHFEIWVRWDFRAIMLAEPDSFHIPKWRQQIDPADPDAAQKMHALRAPMAPGEYHRLRAQQRAEAEALKAAKDLPETRPRGQISGKKLTAAEEPTDAPGGPEPAAAAIVEANAIPASTEPPVPAVLTLEQLREKKRVKSKLARATRSKTRADAKDKASAKAWSDKRVRQLEAAGKL